MSGGTVVVDGVGEGAATVSFRGGEIPTAFGQVTELTQLGK